MPRRSRQPLLSHGSLRESLWKPVDPVGLASARSRSRCVMINLWHDSPRLATDSTPAFVPSVRIRISPSSRNGCLPRLSFQSEDGQTRTRKPTSDQDPRTIPGPAGVEVRVLCWGAKSSPNPQACVSHLSLNSQRTGRESGQEHLGAPDLANSAIPRDARRGLLVDCQARLLWGRNPSLC